MYILAYDLLFGQEFPSIGDAETYLMLKKDALRSALSRILSCKGVKNVEDLMALDTFTEFRKPHYVRVNTPKIDAEYAIRKLRQEYEVQKDDMVPDLLIPPPGADLHKNPLVVNGSIFLQVLYLQIHYFPKKERNFWHELGVGCLFDFEGKASSMAAVALEPKPGWEVIDACSAPGNKTVHLASLMKGRGKILACELDEKRVKHLNYTVELAGATNVEVKHEDFLKLDPKDPSYSKVCAILLDPSCSGSGTAFERLDHLLPSHTTGHSDHTDIKRLEKLAGFQRKVLKHALSSHVRYIKSRMKMLSAL